MTPIENISAIDYAKKWGPWVAVFTGAYGVFIFAFFSEFSPIVRQTAGLEMLQYATGEVLLRATVSAFVARVGILVLSDPIFAFIRITTMQFPLQALRHTPRKWRRRGFRWIAKYRRFADMIYVLIVRLPIEVSLFLTCIIFPYWMTGSLITAFGVALAVACVFFSPMIIAKNVKRGLRLRFRYNTRLDDISDFRRLARSTAILTAAYLFGLMEAKMLIADAVSASVNGELISVVFVSDDHLIGFSEGKAGGHTWRTMSTTGIDFKFQE